MQSNKVEFNLHGVPKTLLLPLYGRAAVSRLRPDYFYDEKAVQLMASLDYNFNNIVDGAELLEHVEWASERAIYFDQAIKAFTALHPQATIVNIGAGLETAFYRVDNGQLQWVDLDVPEVIHLRTQLLTPPERVHYLNQSLLEESWLTHVAAYRQPTFLFAGGVFMYFKPAEVKSTLLAIAKHLPGAQLVFDCLDYRDLHLANDVLIKCDMQGAQFQWGFELEEFKSWLPQIKSLKHESYASRMGEQQSKFARSYMVTVEFA